MTDPQNDKLDKILKKLDDLEKAIPRGFQATWSAPDYGPKLDQIIQLLESLQAKGGKST